MISALNGKDNALKLAEMDPEVISRNWQRSMAVDVGVGFRKLDAIVFWNCQETGFCLYTPPAAAGGGDLYEQLEKFDWYYMKDKWEFSAALELLSPTSSVLEVGVGEGHFLQAAREQGHQAQGVELNPKGAERARFLGFDIYEMTLDELGWEIKHRFDAICSFQVLEHVPQPREFLEGMLNLLKPGGKLILSVPNAAVMRKIDPKNQDLLNQPPHHMGHWDEYAFRSLEGLLPVKLVSVHREPWPLSRWLDGNVA